VDRYEFHKKRDATHYVELVFFYPMGSMGHVVYSGASGSRNVGTLFFILRWDQCGFHKKRVGTCYAELVFLHPVGSVGHVVHSGACQGVKHRCTIFHGLVASVSILQKSVS
jgi:hypothetical protein